MEKLKELKINDRVKIKKWPDSTKEYCKSKWGLVDGGEGKIIEINYDEHICFITIEFDCVKGEKFLMCYNTYDEFDKNFSLIIK